MQVWLTCFTKQPRIARFANTFHANQLVHVRVNASASIFAHILIAIDALDSWLLTIWRFKVGWTLARHFIFFHYTRATIQANVVSEQTFVYFLAMFSFNQVTRGRENLSRQLIVNCDLLTCVAKFALTNKVVCASGLTNTIVLTRVNRARKLSNHSSRVARSQ